jgi:hypothetical protein
MRASLIASKQSRSSALQRTSRASLSCSPFRPPITEALDRNCKTLSVWLGRLAITIAVRMMPAIFLLYAQLALMVRDESEFRRATQTLVRTHPELIATHYFNAVRLAMDENWIGSEDEIKTAERMGFPKERGEAFLSAGIRRRAIILRCLHYAPYVIGGWLLGLAALFLIGKILSGLTLRLIENADPSSSLSKTEMILRSFYRRLITVAGSFYYVSLPFVIVLVLGLAGGVVYAVLMTGYIPIKLVVILVLGAVVTVYKMVQTLFVRVDQSQPGRALRPEEAPDFWNLTREVADQLSTRPLDQIRITTGTEMAVYESGSRKERRQDKGQRTLLMGIGLIPGFNQNSFRARVRTPFSSRYRWRRRCSPRKSGHDELRHRSSLLPASGALERRLSIFAVLPFSLPPYQPWSNEAAGSAGGPGGGRALRSPGVRGGIAARGAPPGRISQRRSE